MQTITSLFSNTFFGVFMNFLNRVGNMLIFIFIIQRISVTEAGVYDLAISYFLIFSRLGLFGLSHLLTRDVSANRQETDKYISNYLYARTALALLMIVLAALFIDNTSYVTTTKIVIFIMLLGILPENINELSQGVYAAYEEVHLGSISIFFNAFVRLAFGILLVFLGYSLVVVAAVLLAGHLIAMFINLVVINRRYVGKWQKPDFRFLKAQLPVALPFIIISTFYILDSRLDKVLISFLDSEESVGLYAAATAVIVSISMLAEAYRIAVLPVMSRYKKTDTTKLQILYLRSYKVMLILGLPLMVITFLLSEEMIQFIYRRDLPAAVPALRIMAVGLGFVFVNALYTRLLFVYNRHHLTAVFMLVSAVINVIVVIWLVPKIGVSGAAVGTTAAHVIRFLLFSWIAFRIFSHREILAYSWRIIIAIVTMSAVMWFLAPFGILIQIGFGALIYLLMLFLVKVISPEERNILYQFTWHIKAKIQSWYVGFASNRA